MTAMPLPTVTQGLQYADGGSGSHQLAAATSSSSSSSSSQSSPFAHLSLTRFSDLIRTIDSASTGTGNMQNFNNKRRRINDSSSTLDRSSGTARPLGIADWAKAKADMRLERSAIVEHRRKAMTGSIGPATAATEPSLSTAYVATPNPSAYAPFCRIRLLQRIATFSLSTYSVRVSIPSNSTTSFPSEQLQQPLVSLARWLEPIGPALNGWQQHKGGKRNELQCPTCTSNMTMAEQIDTVTLLFQEVQSLQKGHHGWCPWTKRSCHPSLYALHGLEDDFVGRLNRSKAKRVFRDLVASVDAVISSDVSVDSPPDMIEGSSRALQAVVFAHNGTQINTKGGLASPAPSPPSLAAVQLALCGWLPSSNAPMPSSRSSMSTTPSSGSTSRNVLRCKSCNRKLITNSQGLSASATSINPVREHRRFCPWVQGEVQSGSYLPSLVPVLAATTGEHGPDEVVDENNAADDTTARLLQSLADAQTQQQKQLPGTTQRAAPPGWLLNLRGLFPSTVADTDEGRSPAAVRGHLAAPVPSGGAEKGGATEQAAAFAGDFGETSPLHLRRRLEEIGANGDDNDVLPKRKKRSSEIVREARSLLFGGGGAAVGMRR